VAAVVGVVLGQGADLPLGRREQRGGGAEVAPGAGPVGPVERGHGLVDPPPDVVARHGPSTTRRSRTAAAEIV
jgi:hypothetical protein